MSQEKGIAAKIEKHHKHVQNHQTLVRIGNGPNK